MNCKNKYQSKEEKIRICKKVVEDGKSSYRVAKEENLKFSGMIRTWIKLYLTNPDLLENKKKPGNPLVNMLTKRI